MHKLALIGFFIITFKTPVESVNQTYPIVKNVTIGQNVTDQINSTTELTYWFTGNVTGKLVDLTINVDCSVSNNANVSTPVRFDVQWKDVIEQPTGTWLLPREFNKYELAF